MITNEDIERYLDRASLAYDTVEDGLWVISDDNGKIVVNHDAPVIVFRAKLMDVSDTNQEALFKRLLELNASEMITAAYGIEENAVVVVASLQSENLDYNEFQGAVDSVTMAMATHVKQLKQIVAA